MQLGGHIAPVAKSIEDEAVKVVDDKSGMGGRWSVKAMVY